MAHNRSETLGFRQSKGAAASGFVLGGSLHRSGSREPSRKKSPGTFAVADFPPPPTQSAATDRMRDPAGPNVTRAKVLHHHSNGIAHLWPAPGTPDASKRLRIGLALKPRMTRPTQFLLASPFAPAPPKKIAQQPPLEDADRWSPRGPSPSPHEPRLIVSTTPDPPI